MPGQAKLIVERMKADKNINFDEDWKVITLFVGGNDLCDFCGKDKVTVKWKKILVETDGSENTEGFFKTDPTNTKDL